MSYFGISICGLSNLHMLYFLELHWIYIEGMLLTHHIETFRKKSMKIAIEMHYGMCVSTSIANTSTTKIGLLLVLTAFRLHPPCVMMYMRSIVFS